ncbi:Hypothetical predicted protein [Mytilus galloprovincialis]|uniref:Uncharacterized protein n=1 Tax=Mytilus galloprovincialis TaxID=29158 RepID=A0A8B6FA10_MYTGA|nr:Hypothetical predicted protein [Mytilus galloprovincialis]
MEEKICSMSTSLDSHLDNINSKIEKLSKCEQLIQDLTLKSDNQPAEVEQRLQVLENKIFDYINSKVTEIKQETKTYSEIEEKVLEFENKFEIFQEKCEHATFGTTKRETTRITIFSKKILN